MNFTQNGSALALPFRDGIAQMCVTSPPYYGLRDYGVAGQIGLEQTPAQYVAQIVAAMREVRRVLRDDGALWLNLGDSYADNGQRKNSNGQGKTTMGWPGQRVETLNKAANMALPSTTADRAPKNLLGIPWRVALALQDDGWILRMDVIWEKSNAMPESVTDRPTKTHEYVFQLAAQPAYFYNAEAMQEAAQPVRAAGANNALDHPKTPATKKKEGAKEFNQRARGAGVNLRNARSVWRIATQPYAGAHFAAMPPALAERCILATSRPGDIVLDPFMGSGTTAMVAIRNGRQAIGTELNLAYLRQQDLRTQVNIGLGLQLAPAAGGAA